jgi:aspartyl-tRNA(Asn)/glutamyl-tRNA(Gln) amidotransferase subunit A
MKPHQLSITEARTLLDRGDISPSDIADDIVSTVEAKDDDIGAYLQFYGDELVEKSRKLTASGGHRGRPLGGIPIAVKDNICIAGRRTTCGSRMLASYHSPYTATVIERLEAAGAIICGKTNCDEFAMGSSNENSAFGPVRNPWSSARVPGGSSGGSAACVAAGLALGALGSDTGGSIRQPAGFCGVVGLKPTYGRVSRYGLVAFASSFDQIGPITHSVEDAALLLEAIAGEDSRDATSLSAPAGGLSDGIDRGLADMTLGVPREFLREEMGGEVRENFDALVDRLMDNGTTVVDVTLPLAEHAVAAYYIIANAEASANLARYDGVKYGHRSGESGDLLELYTRSRGEGFGAEVKRRILLGTYVLSSGYYNAYYLKAQQVRSLFVAGVRRAFQSCDLILLPTSPTPAFELGEKSNDPVQMYMSDVFTVPANLAGLPAISVPSGLTNDRLPLGVQLIAPALGEAALLRGARGIERVVDFKERAYD